MPSHHPGATVNAQDLLSLGTARGVDMSHVGGSATDTKGQARRRRRTDQEKRLGLMVIDTAAGRDSRSYRRRQWSHAELGMAAQGISELHWLAALYSLCGDVTGYWTLWWGLMYQAQRIGQREGWSPMVMGRFPRDAKTGKQIPKGEAEPHLYVDELCRLVLDEDAHRDIFLRAPGLFAAYMDVEELTWGRVLEPRFSSLRSKYATWVASARHQIQRWLIEPDPVEPDEDEIEEPRAAASA